MEIANYKINIIKKCPEDKRKFINEYWEREDSKFVNSPLKTADKYGLNVSHLVHQVKQYSNVIFYLNCKNCNSYERHTSTSHLMFNSIIKEARIPFHFSCNECNILSREQERKNNENAQIEYPIESKVAIESKVWNDLTFFQKNVLIDVLEFDNFKKLKNYYYAKNIKMNNFWATLYALDDYQLISIKRSKCFRYIEDINFLAEILNYLSEIKEKTALNTSKVAFDNESEEIKFVLTKNDNYNNADYPVFSGILTFPEEIIIKPKTEYTFGAWKRSKGHLYLSIIPVENTYNHPKQSLIKHQPMHIRDAINSFFSQRGKDFDV